jgi:hypothetical protein
LLIFPHRELIAKKQEESVMTKPLRIFGATIVAIAIAGSLASATPAAAQNVNYDNYGWGPYAAVTAGALALGMMAATAAPNNNCYYESRPIYQDGYFVGYREVPVC